MQHTQAPRAQILKSMLGAFELADASASEIDGDGVYGEVPALQVLGGAAGTHLGQCSRGWIGLGATLGHIDAPLFPEDHGGAEALMLDGAGKGTGEGVEAGGEIACELSAILGDHHVELTRCAREQQVAHGAADERDVLQQACQEQ